MTRYDQKILFTALAFITVLLKDGAQQNGGRAQKVGKLSDLIGSFCIENVLPVVQKMDFVDESGAAEIDAKINQYIQELRQKHETHLPEDKESLLKFYDRLQMRQSRRRQRGFYAQATTDKLADLVLNYLDEEISDMESLS